MSKINNSSTTSCLSTNDKPCSYLSVYLQCPHSLWRIFNFGFYSSVKMWSLSSYHIQIEDIFLYNNPLKIIWHHTEIVHIIGDINTWCQNIWVFRVSFQNIFLRCFEIFNISLLALELLLDNLYRETMAAFSSHSIA